MASPEGKDLEAVERRLARDQETDTLARTDVFKG
jgi:hypothetical protein